jgi:hypothetical protein
MMTYALDAWDIAELLEPIRCELADTRRRILLFGEDRRHNGAWEEALVDLVAAIEKLLEQPKSEVRGLRVVAAESEAKRIAQACAWDVVADIVNALRGEKWPRVVGIDDRDISDGQSFAVWARHNPRRVIDIGGDRVVVNKDSIKVQANACTWLDEPLFVECVVLLDELDGWVPPKLPAPPKSDAALLGYLTHSQLIDFAAFDPFLAVFARNATTDVFKAAGANVQVDPFSGEVTIVLPNNRIVAGCIRRFMESDLVLEQVSKLVPVDGVVMESVILSKKTGEVKVIIDGYPDQFVGVVDVDQNIGAAKRETEALLVEKGFIESGKDLDWNFLGYLCGRENGFYYGAILSIEVV